MKKHTKIILMVALALAIAFSSFGLVHFIKQERIRQQELEAARRAQEEAERKAAEEEAARIAAEEAKRAAEEA